MSLQGRQQPLPDFGRTRTGLPGVGLGSWPSEGPEHPAKSAASGDGAPEVLYNYTWEQRLPGPPGLAGGRVRGGF